MSSSGAITTLAALAGASPRRLSIHTSNRLEVLVERFARMVAEEPLPPLEREIVVVQSLGMSRWLTLELARRNGLSASLSTPFPAPFARWLAPRLLEGGAVDGVPPASEEIPRRDDSLWSRPLLVWRLMRHLATAGDDPGLEAAASALRPAPALDEAESLDPVDLAQRRLYELAHRLAGLYDGYQLFRPRMLRAWARGEPMLDLDGSQRTVPPRDRETAAWQSHLWRRLVSETIDGRPIEPPFSENLLDLVARLESVDTVRADRLPRRLTVFGATSLPPAFIDLLAALSRFVPVSIDFVSPTHHYWADVRSEREQERLHRRLQRAGDAQWVESQHVEAGNPLLAALGRQGRELFDLLQRADAGGSAWQELEFVEPRGERSTALEIVQSDILHLVERGAGAARLPLPPDLRPDAPDGLRSLEVHVCHSPGREMEVLRDRLLATFAADPTLRASDVLVLVPDVELYGPFVQAIFSARGGESDPALPFSIADRGAGRERPPAETLLDLLDLVGARLVQRDVFDLLDVAAVRRAAGLTHGDLPRLRRLAEAARVRWGVDGAQKRRDFDVPGAEQNTWRAGIDRLILGYATGALGFGDPIDGSEGAGDLEGGALAGAVRGVDRAVVVPLAGDTAGDAESLGRFALFLDTLFAHLERLRAPRPLTDWSRDLVAAIDALLEPEGEAEEMGVQLARDACAELAEAAERIGWAVDPSDDETANETAKDDAPRAGPSGDAWTEVALPAVREHLEARLRGDTFGSGFLDGRITFAQLEPMRSIPFRVVALCGLDDGVFPRRDPESGLDLVRRAPRPGDRSLREDDRHLFLEMLLAARDKLLLSHVGRSQLDGAERAPSPVLAELLDHLDRTFEPAPGDRAARDAVVAVHRLQPWSAAAFDRERPMLWSASSDALRAARTAERTRGAETEAHDLDLEASRFADPAGPALSSELADRSTRARVDAANGAEADADDALEIVALDELIRFWIDPSRAFCRALGLRLPDGPEAVDEAEPFTVRGLDGWRMRQDMLERRLARTESPIQASAEERNKGKDEGKDEEKDDDDRHAALRAERELLQARGLLPPGALGAALHRELDARVEAFRARLPPHHRLPPRQLAIEATTGALRWRLRGRVRSLTDRGPLIVRCGPLRPRDAIRAWITHLALAAEGATPPTAETRVVAETETLRLPPAPADRARALLGVLIDGRRQGLVRPLPVFERASHAFVEAHLRGVDPSRAGARRSPKDLARDVFHGRERPAGDAPPAEADDEAVRQAFRREAEANDDTRSSDPLDLPAFEIWSRRLWEPILRIVGPRRPA